MKNSFWGLIWSSFLEIQGVLVGFLGIGLSILAWVFSSETQVSLALIITIAIFLLIVIITLFQAAYQAFRQMKKLETEVEKLKQDNQNLKIAINQRNIPKILRVQKDLATTFYICLLEKSDLFTFEARISFYYTDNDGFERLIGIGYVSNLQNDGKMQVVIDNIVQNYQNILDQLANNDAKVLEKTTVRPSIPRNINQP